MIECQCQMIVNVLREKWRRKAKVVAVRESATNKFLEQWRKDIDKSVWRPGNCNSWYQRASSKIFRPIFRRFYNGEGRLYKVENKIVTSVRFSADICRSDARTS